MSELLLKASRQKISNSVDFWFSCFPCEKDNGKPKKFNSASHLLKHTEQCHKDHPQYNALKRVIRNTGYGVQLGVVRKK